MRRFFFTILFIAGISPAMAAEKITITQAQQLSTALRNLDGHLTIIKQNGSDAAIMTPWDFGSGSLRLRIANNISILDAALAGAETARQAILKEQLAKLAKRTGETATELKPGSPEYDEFQKQYGELAAGPANGTQDLARIKATELKLDKNEVPVTVLVALKPVMDDDTPK